MTKDDLANLIENAGSENVSSEEAQRLAAIFLHARMKVSDLLRAADMDSRARKSGLKAIRAALYLKLVQGVDKRPTEAHLASLIDNDSLVSGEQNAYDSAEVDVAELKRLDDIYANAHVFFRTASREPFGS